MVVWAHGALLAARNIPIFMIVAAPPVAAAIQQWRCRTAEANVAGWVRAAAERFNRDRERDRRNGLDRPLAPGERRWACVLVAAVIYAPNPPKKFRAEFDPEVYPAAALATLRGDTRRAHLRQRRMGRLPDLQPVPETGVFVDGRSDFYGNDFEEKYLDVLNVKYGWEKTLSRFHIDTILLPPGRAAGRRAEGIQQVARRLRRRRRVGLPVRWRGRGANRFPSLQLQGGEGRDREVTKTLTSDRAITKQKPNPKLRSERHDDFAQLLE